MHFNRGGPREKAKLYFGNKLINWTERYTYLGVPFSTSFLRLIAANAASQKAKSAMGAALSTVAAIKADSWASINKIFNSIAASTLLYSLYIWGLHHLDFLEKTQLLFYKRLLLLPLSTPSAELRLEIRATNVKVQVLKMALG